MAHGGGGGLDKGQLKGVVNLPTTVKSGRDEVHSACLSVGGGGGQMGLQL